MRWRRARNGQYGQRRIAQRCALTALAVVAVACGKDALVGGSCRQGLTECSLRCIDLQQDLSNCGACGHACAAGQTCAAGACSGTGGGPDAGDAGAGPDASDASEDGAGVADGRVDDVSRDGSMTDTSIADTRGDGTISDGAMVDVSGETSVPPEGGGGDIVVGDGVSPDAPTCMPPYDTPEHCGDCDTKCVDPTPLCGLQGTYKCVARCDPPLVACGPICVNTSSDEKNCGSCGVGCPSGICQAGGCVGKGYGHEVVIGMDYSDASLSESSAQVTMLGNAIFQSVATSVRVLAYDEFAQQAPEMRIEGWLSSLATGRGKSVTIVRASDWTVIPQQLTVTQYQVLLVYDQPRAPDNQMATTGTLWNAAMNAFAKGGGIIVALDGGSAGRMRDFLSNGGLLAVTDETDVSSAQLDVDAPTDVVGQNLPNIFAAKKATVAFTTTQMRDNYHVFVVTDTTGMLPVVVHSVPKP